MISIKKFLGEDETSETLIYVLQLLLQGIGLHVVEGDPEDYDRFRLTLEEASGVLGASPQPPAAQFLVEAGAVIQALEDYNRQTNRLFQMRRTELQSMVTLLAQTVQAVAAEGGESVARLKNIEDQVSAATQLDDIHILRLKLDECLKAIREETARRRRQTEETRGAMRQYFTGGDPPATVSQMDRVTGLPGRTAAEEALAAATRSPKIAYAAVMVLDRIQSYNAAFGIQIGDEVLQHFAEIIGGKLSEGQENYRLFRWSGPALILLIEKVNRIENLREDLAALLAQPFEHEIRTHNRNLRLPITSRWTLLPMMAAHRLLIQRIDHFVATPHGADL